MTARVCLVCIHSQSIRCSRSIHRYVPQIREQPLRVQMVEDFHQMRHIPDASGESLLPFVHEVVAPGSVVRTDGWSGYNGLTDYGYTRDILVQSSSGDPAHVSMPGVHRVASLLKRWLLGTHQGSVLSHHLQSYLEEFTFRFNRRTSRSRGLVFRRLLEQAVITGPVTQTDIIYGYDWGCN